jgi:ribonuclease R
MKKKKINKESKQKESRDSSAKHKSPKVSGGKHKHPGASHRGVIDITRSGMGYVTVVDMERDVIVRPQHFNTALHGDTVEVQITKSGGGGGRVEGEIVSSNENKRNSLAASVSKRITVFLFRRQTDQCPICLYQRIS